MLLHSQNSFSILLEISAKEGTIKYRQSRETGNTTKKTKQKHNTICVGHKYTQANSNNVNKISAFLQTTGGKDEPNIILFRR